MKRSLKKIAVFLGGGYRSKNQSTFETKNIEKQGQHSDDFGGVKEACHLARATTEVALFVRNGF